MKPKNLLFEIIEGIKATNTPHSYKETVVSVVEVVIPISVPPTGYVVDPAIFSNIVIVEVNAMFEAEPLTTIEAVSLTNALAETQPS